MTATCPFPADSVAARPTEGVVTDEASDGTTWRLIVLAVAIVVSHAAALWTTYAPLIGGIGRDGAAGLDPNGPLVFVPFIPLGALAIALARWRGADDEPAAVPQRAADAVIAAFFFGVAWAMARTGPAVFDIDTLAWRADLLSLAPFTAGVVVVLFGGRMLTRLRPAIGMLTLMAPAMYRPIIEVARDLSSRATMFAVAKTAPLIPNLTTSGRADGQYMVLGQGADRSVVAVTSACGGGGSVLAALAVGAVVWHLTVGGRRRKLAWLATAVLLAWFANVGRLVMLVAAANVWGPSFTLAKVHPWLGTVTLVGALCTATLLLPRFGLTRRPSSGAARPFRAVALPDLSLLALVLAATLLVAGPAHAATVSKDLTRGASRDLRPSATAYVSDLAGARELEDVPWVAEYLGQGSTWKRWLLFESDGGRPVAIDVTATPDPTRLDQYGLAACLGFHDAVMLERSVIPLPGGRLAERFTFKPEDGVTTTILSWRQRVNGATERIVLHRPVEPGETLDEAAEPLRLVAIEILLGVEHGRR